MAEEKQGGLVLQQNSSSARDVSIAERRSMCIELRKAGMSYSDISDAVIKHFGLSNLPAGYDEKRAHKDVMAVLELTRKEMFEDAQTIIELELERLDEILMSLWDRALGGDLKAVDKVLAVMQRRAKMLGLDKTNLYLEADWKKEAEVKGISPEKLYERIVDAYVKSIEQGAEDAEFADVSDGAREDDAGGMGGSSEESDSEGEA